MAKKMMALVKEKPEPGLWMREIDIPETGSDDILIRIKKTSICGTDLHIYNWNKWAARTIRTPMTIGHEFVGEIADIGSRVRGWEIGERVSGEGQSDAELAGTALRGEDTTVRTQSESGSTGTAPSPNTSLYLKQTYGGVLRKYRTI